MAKLTYLPREGDPASTRWNGHHFPANVPVDVQHPQMVSLAKGNPWFKVEEEELTGAVGGLAGQKSLGEFVPTPVDAAAQAAAQQQLTPAKPDPAIDPSDKSEQYKTHALDWIRTATSTAGMDQQWAAEEQMRVDMGVGTEDIEFLAKFYGPKYEALKQAEVEAAQQP